MCGALTLGGTPFRPGTWGGPPLSPLLAVPPGRRTTRTTASLVWDVRDKNTTKGKTARNDMKTLQKRQRRAEPANLDPKEGAWSHSGALRPAANPPPPGLPGLQFWGPESFLHSLWVEGKEPFQAPSEPKPSAGRRGSQGFCLPQQPQGPCGQGSGLPVQPRCCFPFRLIHSDEADRSAGPTVGHRDNAAERAAGGVPLPRK